MLASEYYYISAECLGVSGDADLSRSNNHDIVKSQQLELALKNQCIHENEYMIQQKRQILYDLEVLLNECILLHNPTAKGKVFTFGSYRFGVQFQGDDIDVLLIAPETNSRDEIFNSLVSRLYSKPGVKELCVLKEYSYPRLKIKINNIDIDLQFVSVAQESIPTDFFSSLDFHRLLLTIFTDDLLILNFARVPNEIFRLVNDKETFRSALIVIRFWAKRRRIYSERMGFCGGVSWAILVAHVCQLWPLASSYTIVFNFFKLYGTEWVWPSPVRLKEIEMPIIGNMTPWNFDHNVKHEKEVMPIITPTYPSQNSSLTVCDSHKRFMTDQMKKAFEILEQIIRKEATFEDLFNPLFFFSFQHYLIITYRYIKENEFKKEDDKIESNLRLLVQQVERNESVKFAVLYSHSYDFMDSVPCRRWYIGIELKRVETSSSFDNEIMWFKNVVKVGVEVFYSHISFMKNYIAQEFHHELENFLPKNETP